MASSNLVAPELASIAVAGTTREAFLIRATLAAGATYGALSATPYITRALAADSGGDVDILNYALTLEYLETEFYTLGVKRVKGLSGDELKLAKEIRDNEAEHVDALAATVSKLGGRQRLQRRGSADRVRRRARCGRQHRPGRGAPRVAHPPGAQQAAGAAGVRQGGDDGRDPREGQAVHRELSWRSRGARELRGPGICRALGRRGAQRSARSTSGA
jgi:hypothetical protein